MRDVARNDGFWRKKLAQIAPVQIPTTHANNDPADPRPITLASQPTADQVARWAVALSGMSSCDLAYSNASLLPTAARGFVAPWGFAIDLPARDPNIGSVQTPQIGFAAAGGLIAGTLITVTSEGTLIYDAARVPTALATLLAARLESGSALPDAERDAVLNQWNATQVDYDASPIHHLFQAQVAKTPDATALVFEGESLTYAQLDARANRAAHVLIGMGVGPDTLVGLCCHRSLDLVIGALGILKAGGAYVPLDPAYPADRLAHYISDSAAPCHRDPIGAGRHPATASGQGPVP
ncbi:Linear gramicidin synthase subunit D [Nymphon striatum]|nr:Linear gramicidin synthase subunit D [Nymphon striatum]